MSGTWDQPDFSDPRFRIDYVDDAPRCRHNGCDELAAHLVQYTMRRGGWTYEYDCGYCDEHLPSQAREHAEASA